MHPYSQRTLSNHIATLALTLLAAFSAIMISSNVPSNATTEDNVDSSLQADKYPTESEIHLTLDKYATTNLDGSTFYDVNEAEQDNVDPRIVEIAEVANDITSDSKGKQELAQPADLNPTNYGNWCGKNNSGPGEPINELDRACMGHDHCLNINRPTCDCDQEFVSRLREIRGQFSGWARTYLEAAIVAVPTWRGC